MKMYLGACVVLSWAALTAIVWLWVKAATRRDDDVPEYDVQPWDMPTTWTFAAGASFTVTTDDQSETTGRPN